MNLTSRSFDIERVAPIEEVKAEMQRRALENDKKVVKQIVRGAGWMIVAVLCFSLFVIALSLV